MIKKIVIGVFVLLGLLTLTGSIFIYLNEDVIIHEIQEQVKKSGASLDMKDMEITFLRTFPAASARISDMSISTEGNAPMVSAKTMSFQLNLKKLLRGDIAIKKIVLENGHIQLIKSQNGKSNFTLNNTKQSAQNDPKSFSLDALELKQMDFTFHDEKQGHLVRLKKINTIINPLIGIDGITADIELQGLGEAMSLGNQLYFFNQEVTLNSSMTYVPNSLHISQARLQIGDSQLNFIGEIQQLDSDIPTIDITLNRTEGRIEHLTDFLPTAWFESIDQYNISGDYDLTGSFKGKLGGPHIPRIKIQADISSAELTHEAVLHPIKNGKGRLTFAYGGVQAGQIQLPQLTGIFQGKPVKLSFAMNSFENSKIKTTISGVVSLLDVNPELIPSIFIRDQGEIELKDFIVSSDKNLLHYEGTLYGKGLSGLISGVGFTISDGTFRIDDDRITISPTTFEALGEQHEIHGEADLENAEYDLHLTSDKIDVVQFFNALSTDESVKVKQVNNSTVKAIKATIHLKALKVQHEHIRFGKTQAEIRYAGEKVYIKSKMKYCLGTMKGSGSFNMSNGKTDFKAEATEVDMNAIFEQWNNFDQEQVMAKHIRGLGDVQCVGTFIYQSGEDFDPKTMNMVGGIRIKNGELKQVPLFEQFSSYIHNQDLSQIKFNSLVNVFKIEKGRLHLPEMFIQSNAANIILAGHQTLDNQLNYALKINAGQVLTNKIKKHDSKLQPVKAKNKGFFNLHYIIRGPIDNFEYFANKRAVNDKLEQSLFIRDEIVARLGSKFDVGDRYESPHLFQEIPEELIEEDSEMEFVPGF